MSMNTLKNKREIIHHKLIIIALFLSVFIINKSYAVVHVTVSNPSYTGVLGNVKIFHYEKGNDAKLPGEGSLPVGATRHFTLPDKNYEIAVGYFAFYLIYVEEVCTLSIPEKDNTNVSVSITAGGEFASKFKVSAGMKRLKLDGDPIFDRPLASSCVFAKD